MTQAIDRLSEFVASTSFEEIPERLRERTADCILDVLGSAAGGLNAPATIAMSKALPPYSSSAQIWFRDGRGDVATVAMQNAMAATALDIDDGHRMAAGHPGAAIIAAALAAMSAQATTDDVITAIVLGFEVSVRVALARVAEHHHSTVSGRWSGTGAAAAIAKLRGLPATGVAQSILIAEQHAPRLGSAHIHGFAGSDVKEGIAWSVYAGAQAVSLAAAGFRGYPNTFDQGVLYDPEKLVASLGRFGAIDGLYFKRYACCRWIHAAIDAALHICKEIRPNAIDDINVRTFQRAVDLGNSPQPSSEVEAQFSVPFCVALAVVHGPENLLPLDLEYLNDPEVIALARKVRVSFDDTMEQAFPAQTPAIVEVQSGGNLIRHQADAPFGDPTNPMSRDDLVAKLSTLAGPVIGQDRVAEISQVLGNFGQASPTGFLHCLRAI